MTNSIEAARPALRELSGTVSHPGLALDVLLARQGDPQSRGQLLDQVVAKGAPAADYEAAYQRWFSQVKGLPHRAMEVTVATPLAIGLGNSSPLEIGLALHRTWGQPVLPGSALKGLARRMANRAQLSREQVVAIFGGKPGDENGPDAGTIVFWDAWMVPQKTSPFCRDVITVHHPRYYQSQGKEPPTDFDDPTPIAFLRIATEVKFQLVLSAPSVEWAEWLDAALVLVGRGLETEGFGAKTNAGYGRFLTPLAPIPDEPVAQSGKPPEQTPQPEVVVKPVLSDGVQQLLDQAKQATLNPGMWQGVQEVANNFPEEVRKEVASILRGKSTKALKPEKATQKWILDQLGPEA